MFAKDRSSTIGGKKDVPIRKSDRRKLRDRVLEVLFTSDDGGKEDTTTKNDDEWISRAQTLIDDCLVTSKSDILSRKMKMISGEHATLFFRTPSPSSSSDNILQSTANNNNTMAYVDLLKAYPTTWPYTNTIQPILLEYEDSTDRKVNLLPLLPLLAALPPPLSSPPLCQVESNVVASDDSNDLKKSYRIPNIVIHSEVSKYMCRGADLMRSGIRSFPTPWSLRQSKGLVTISVIGNPQVVAIGRVEHSLFREYCYNKNGKSSQNLSALTFVGQGKKGVGVSILNCYGDDLWKNSLPTKSNAKSKNGIINPLGGSVYDDGNYGNKGFVDGSMVYPILEVGDDESDSDESQVGDTTTAVEMEQMTISDTVDTKEEGIAAIESTTNDTNQENKEVEEAEPDEPDHDEILKNAFFKSLLLMLSSKTPLPLPVSQYYAKHLLAAVDGHRLNMKQTTYKKIGPFLKEMEADGVIKLGASKDKKDKCAFINDITKNNPDLLQFKRNWKKELESSGGDLSSMKASPGDQKTKLAVVDLFIVPRQISEGMQLEKDAVMAINAKTEERKGTGFLTKTECRALVEGYIEKEQLVDPNSKGRISINGPLCDALYRVSKKNKQAGQKTEYPTSVKRKELIEKWLERMDTGHAVVQMPGSKILQIRRGAPKPVEIEVEFRQGNRRKFLTHLRGMEEYGIGGEGLAQEVSHRFACSSSIETDPVGRPALKKDRVEITFQGHLSEELTALLTGDEKTSSHGGAKGSDYSLPKSVINVALRKGVPARKKR